MKRVWVIALAGWLVALVNCIGFVVASLPEPDATVARTCDEVLVYQVAAFQAGDLIMLAEANRRAVELGC
jgi:hypothetical protein